MWHVKMALKYSNTNGPHMKNYCSFSLLAENLKTHAHAPNQNIDKKHYKLIEQLPIPSNECTEH